MNPATNTEADPYRKLKRQVAVLITMMMKSTSKPQSVKTILTDEMLSRFAPARHLRPGKSFLRSGFRRTSLSKYLLLPVRRIWRRRLEFAEICCQQRRLAYHAPATALAVNMHVYWVGVAADLGAAEINHWNGCCVKRPPVRSSPPAMPKVATTSQCCSQPPKQSVSRAATGSPGESTLAVYASLDQIWLAWDGYQRSHPTKDRARIHAARYRRLHDQGNLGCAGYARHPK